MTIYIIIHKTSDNNILQTYANIVEENTLDMFKSLDDILLLNANLIKRT